MKQRHHQHEQGDARLIRAGLMSHAAAPRGVGLWDLRGRASSVADRRSPTENVALRLCNYQGLLKSRKQRLLCRQSPD